MGFDGGDFLRLGKKLIKGGAPILGDLVTGGAGGKAVSIISTLLGIDSDPNVVEKALEAKPELLLELRKYEMEHAVELQKLQIQDAQMYLVDVQSARNRDIELVKATGKRDAFMYALAGTLFFGFILLTGIVTYLIFTKQLANIDANMVLLMGTLYGTLSSGFLAVVYFFFGSSKSSDDKNGTIRDMVKDAASNNK
jgi:hypothetical protein